MGRTYDFVCPHCQFKACVSGGADEGLNCSILTIHCRDCRALFDVFTRIRRKDRPADEPQAKSPKTKMLPSQIVIPPPMLVENPVREFKPGVAGRPPASPFHWQQVKPVCPVAITHSIEPWAHPGRCPQCGTFLEKNGFPHRLWE